MNRRKIIPESAFSFVDKEPEDEPHRTANPGYSRWLSPEKEEEQRRTGRSIRLGRRRRRDRVRDQRIGYESTIARCCRSRRTRRLERKDEPGMNMERMGAHGSDHGQREGRRGRRELRTWNGIGQRTCTPAGFMMGGVSA